MADQDTPGPGTVGPERSQNFEQCLELLRGPGDERRFVGLLLVTRLLPQGSDDAVRRVLEALGTRFLHRLLLPLRRPPQTAGEALHADAAAQQATSCGLALAILAAACRLPDFAAGPDVRELLPVLIRVVQYGGVSRVLQPGAAAVADAVAADADADAPEAAAVSDALECLVGAAAAAPDLTFSALEHCPALEALAAFLTAVAAALTSTPPSSNTTPGGAAAAAAAIEAQQHHATLLTAALLERMLSGSGGDGGGGRAVAVFAEHPAAAARTMAALSALVGNPRLRLPPTTASAAGQSPAASQQRQQQQQMGSGAPAASTARHEAAGGAAQLQLEALHLLLLMLRACQEPAAAAAARELVRLDERVAWSAAVRRGLGWLLRSRAPAALRHSALQLAALVLELVGERWLLGPPAVATAGAAALSAQDSDQPGSFLLLLTETLKIETGLLLLQDALNPDRRVPALDSHRSYAALGQASSAAAPMPPAPSQRLLDELAARAAQRQAAEAAAVQAAVDAAAGAGAGPATATATASAAPPPPLALQDVAVDAGASTPVAMEVEEVGSGAPGGAAVPAAMATATMPAGQRALVLVPACFRLLEGSVEAVAADASAADERMEVDEMEDVPTAAAARGAGAPRLPSPPQPLLSDPMLQKLMGGLESIADLLLQFFEAATEQQQQQEAAQEQRQQGQQQLAAGSAAAQSAAAEGAPGGAVSSALLLGAARVLGRYLAEVPGAVRSGRLLRVLPRVMAVRRAAGGGAGAAAAAGLEGGGDELDLDLDDFALPFLLPGLLQATGPGADGRADTARALRSSPAALDACVTYFAHCVKCAVGAAPHAERAIAGGAGAAAGGGGAAALAALVRSEHSMADVSMLLLNLLEPSVLGSLAAGRGTADAAAAAADGGVPAAWRVVQHCRAGGAAAEAREAAVAAAATELPPLLAQLLPVCWLVQRWAAAREGALRALLSVDPLAPPRHDRGDGDGTAVSRLFRSQLGTRALLCTACLAAVTLAAAMFHLVSAAAAAAAAGGGGTPSQTQQTSMATAVSVVLPPTVMEGVGAAALAAAAAGASLEAAQLRAAAAAAAPPPPFGTQRLPLTLVGLAEDFPGDGEVCWERLLGASAQLVEMSGVVRRLAAAGVTGGVDGSSGASWLQQLAAARARGDPAAAELLLSEVNLALLLQVVAANAQTG